MTVALQADREKRYFKGRPRPFDEAMELSVIDEKIRSLCIAMNVPGRMRTIASCEGHGNFFGQTSRSPYISFVSEISVAGKLDQLLQDDQVSISPKLKYFWRVTGEFSGMELRFCLRGEIGFYRRKKVDADLSAILSMLPLCFEDSVTIDTANSAASNFKIFGY